MRSAPCASGDSSTLIRTLASCEKVHYFAATAPNNCNGAGSDWLRVVTDADNKVGWMKRDEQINGTTVSNIVYFPTMTCMGVCLFVSDIVSLVLIDDNSVDFR